ncbi:hypothetical protein GLOIN_2v1770854 [Rhizophagus irregularis DAOM 181602=DAOM 197198]|nr:hypothetical protein GLOIN_2v1770854 [Rhizophagus irregularis DAOM 181602=DAOM 197198]
MSSPTSKNYITCGENDNEFNITMPPTILNLKDLNSKNCKEFTIIIIGFIELKGKAFLVPPSIEMSVTAFGTNLGYVKGDLEQVALLNMSVPFIDGDCGEIKLFQNIADLLRSCNKGINDLTERIPTKTSSINRLLTEVIFLNGLVKSLK